MDTNDFVFKKNKDGSFQSGGYKFNSSFLENNYSPITSYKPNDNGFNQTGGNPAITQVFSNIAIPAGLLLLQQTFNAKYTDNIISNKKPELVEQSLYDKLLNIASINNYKKKPRTPKNLDNKKTKKISKKTQKKNTSNKTQKKNTSKKRK